MLLTCYSSRSLCCSPGIHRRAPSTSARRCHCASAGPVLPSVGVLFTSEFTVLISEFSQRQNNCMRESYFRIFVLLFDPADFFFALLLIVSFTKYLRASEMNFCTMGDS